MSTLFYPPRKIQRIAQIVAVKFVQNNRGALLLVTPPNFLNSNAIYTYSGCAIATYGSLREGAVTEGD